MAMTFKYTVATATSPPGTRTEYIAIDDINVRAALDYIESPAADLLYAGEYVIEVERLGIVHVGPITPE